MVSGGWFSQNLKKFISFYFFTFKFFHVLPARALFSCCYLRAEHSGLRLDRSSLVYPSKRGPLGLHESDCKLNL